MPIYEYQCKSCGHELEKLQRMNDPILTDCPVCSQSELKRLVSAARFRLKGSGWYETDFKKDNKKNLHDSGDSGNGASKSGSSAAKSTSKSSDTKSSDAKSPGKESGKAVSKKTGTA
jgi:putative FmdB family regulatory protein